MLESKSGIKVLAKGELDRKLTVKAHKFSVAAKAIENARRDRWGDLRDVQNIKGAFTEKEVRGRVFFTLAMLFVFLSRNTHYGSGCRCLSVKRIITNRFIHMLKYVRWGSFIQLLYLCARCFTLHYILIIVQLLQMDVIPKFKEWSEQGEVGRRKLNSDTRYGTIALGMLQGLGISYGFNALADFGLVRNQNTATFVTIAVILTAGTMIVMWLGEMSVLSTVLEMERHSSSLQVLLQPPF